MDDTKPLKTFKAPSGKWLLGALFVDAVQTWRTDDEYKQYALYSLKDQDVNLPVGSGPEVRGYPSLKRLYLEEEDLTEYLFATKYFGGWHHWKLICEGPLRDKIAEWRTELELKLQAKALKSILIEAECGTKNQFQANKYLMQKGWVTSDNRRGRPTKADIQKQASEIAHSDDIVSQAAKRLEIN